MHEPDAKELIAFLKAMEFTTITKRVAAHFEIEDLDAIAADAHGGQCAAASEAGIAAKLEGAARRPDDAAHCARRSTTTPMSR